MTLLPQARQRGADRMFLPAGCLADPVYISAILPLEQFDHCRDLGLARILGSALSRRSVCHGSFSEY